MSDEYKLRAARQKPISYVHPDELLEMTTSFREHQIVRAKVLSGKATYSDRFQNFISLLPDSELLELTSGAIEHYLSGRQGDYLYKSSSLGATERVHQDDLLAIFAEVKKRFLKLKVPE